MRYFTLLDFQHFILAFFLGLLGAIFAYVAWRYHPPRIKEDAKSRDQVFSDHEGQSRPVAPILIFIYIGAVLSALGYAILRGIMGKTGIS